MIRSEDRKNRTGLVFLLIFIGLAAGILAGGYNAYQNYEQNFHAKAERQLSAIAELKVNQLVQYRAERLGDAQTLFKNSAFSTLVSQFFTKTNKGNAQRQLRDWFARLQRYYSYDGIFLLDTQGILRLSVPERTVPICSLDHENAMELLHSKVVTVQDFHRNEYNQKIYLTLLVPIIDDANPGHLLGILLLRIDPAMYLYPFIQTWPVPSRTSETLIVRREGNDVLFLNELRFQKNSALNLRFSLSNEKLPAAQAALGHTGVMEGVDYRGEVVIAALRSVPDSPWFLVARMDEAEVNAPLQARLWIMVILVGALISASGAGVGLVWRHQRTRFYKEQFKAAELLRESEVRFRQTFDLSPVGIVMVGLDKRFLGCNRAFSQFLGYATDEITERTIGDITFPEDRSLGMAEMTALGNGEITNSSVQKRYVRKDGQIVWGEVTMSLVRDQEEHPRYFLSIVQDITERRQSEVELRRLFDISERSRSSLLSILEDQKRVEEALRESQSLYHSFIEQLPNAVFRKDREGRYVLVNPEFCRLKGLKKEGFIGRKPLEVAAGEMARQGSEGQAIKYADVGEDVHEQILRTGKIFEAEEEYPRPDGGTQHMYVVRMPVFDSHQTIIGTQGIMFDVSERMRAEEALLESERKYRLIADHADDWIYWRAPDGSLRYMSPSCERVTGYSLAEFTEHPSLFEEITHPDDRLSFVQHAGTLRSDNTPEDLEFRIITKSGALRWISHTCSPVYDEEGKYAGRRGTNRNITERKHAEEEIQRLNAELEQRVIERTAQLESANKELEAFSYSVSHDLRAPLRSIDGFSQALLEDSHDKLDEHGRNHLNRVRNAAQRMGQLIDDVLDLSRIQRAEMSRVAIDLSMMAKEIVADLRRQQPRSHVEVIIGSGISAQGDPQLMRLCLQNLLENAWKFSSKHKQATIEFGSRELDGKKVFFVKDDGAGFDMAHADMLFAPFQRLHAQTEFPGTGIGLASVQRIIHRHGGRIWAESELDKGATFYFTL